MKNLMSAKLAVTSAVAVVLALAGCSSHSGSTDATGPDDGTVATSGAGDGGDTGGSALSDAPCSIITQAQASAAYGEDLSAGKAVAVQEGSATCTYAGTIGSVVIVVNSNGDTPWDVLVNANKGVLKDQFTELDGIGDAAFSNGVQVYILVGTTIVSIQVIGPFTDAGDRAVTLAQQASL